MSLLQLPTELLLLVLDFLGPEFFAQDTRRLTVSKSWYHLAWQILVRDLQFSSASLVSFTGDDALLARSQAHVGTLRLRFDPYQPVPGDSSVTTPLCDDDDKGDDDEGDDDGADDDEGEGDGDSDDDDYDEWASQINASLLKLASALQQSRRVWSLEIHARLLDVRYGQYLLAQSLADLFSACHLTSLVFDAASSYINQPQDSGAHLCRSINALLPSLRTLRCRMNYLCPALLEPPGGGQLLPLEEVIVNLSLSQLSDEDKSYQYSRGCRSMYGGSSLQLKEDMEGRATALFDRLCNPRMVRIISHRLPFLEIMAFDATTRRQVQLENNLDWDAEGEQMDEERLRQQQLGRFTLLMSHP